MEENEEAGYTLTSFEPLSPEDEKSGLRKFMEGFSKTKLATLISFKSSHNSQSSLETSTQNANHNDSQLYLNSNVEKMHKVPNESTVTPPQAVYSRKNESQIAESKIDEIDQGRNGPSRNTRTPSSVLRRLSQLVLLEKAYPEVEYGSIHGYTLLTNLMQKIFHSFCNQEMC